MTSPVSAEFAIQLVYLVAGVEPVLQTHQVKARLNPAVGDHPMTFDGGHVGMVSELMPYAQAVAGYIEKMVGVQDFPSVFEYEVTEPLGAWLANFADEENGWPPLPQFVAELEKQGSAFFSQ